MNILIVDDEVMMLEETKDIVLEVAPDAFISCADNYMDALTNVKKNRYDIALLDIEMPGMNGLELAKNIKDISPDTNIIFVTAYSEYAFEAHSLYVSGYLLKPINKDDVEKAFNNLRNPIKEIEKSGKLKFKCFGKFEVFYDDEPLHFERSRAKEILAYLIDLKGASANTSELCTILWEDEGENNKKHYLRVLIRDLKNALKECNSDDILICKRNQYSIDISNIDCDYYKFLKKDISAVNSYRGQYMNQYGWAEMTLGFLENAKKL